MEITKFRIEFMNFTKNEISEISRLTRMLISTETSVELSELSVDFSERNASVAKPRNLELLCVESRVKSLFYSVLFNKFHRKSNLIALLYSKAN
jgi:hypothetical protein